MGFRFRRSVTLCPGVRMNFGLNGMSWSLGPRGASINVGPRGTYLNASLPGTGISYRERLGVPAASRRGPPAALSQGLSMALTADGDVVLRDGAGHVLAPGEARQTRQALAGAVAEFVEEACQAYNDERLAIREIHRLTPDLSAGLVFEERPFPELPPTPPEARSGGWLQRLLPGDRERAEREAAERLGAHRRSVEAWERRRRAYGEAEAARRHMFERERLISLEAMEHFLADHLAALSWPRETRVAFCLADRSTLLLDVDLPEIADLPGSLAQPGRMRVTLKPLSETQRRQDYARHIHGVALRMVGEAFVALPKVKDVVFSGYSQRPDPATGHLRDEYLLSVRVAREAWSRIDFSSLSSLDPSAALTAFSLRRDLSRSGVFRAVEPFGSNV